MTDPSGIRDQVQARYAAAAQQAAAGGHEAALALEASCCGPAPVVTTDADGTIVFGAELYDTEAADGATGAALSASLGCGVPTAVADLNPGETVLDLGSGAGVINLAADQHVVLREAARVLRPGGRFAVSDVVADPGMDEATRADMAGWAGCIAGALTTEEFIQALTQAGLVDPEIHETHRVHSHASAAIVRARKPATGT